MATGSQNIPASPPPPPPATAAAGRDDPYDRLIQQKLDTTRTHLKIVDLIGGLMGLVAFCLATLLLLAVIDHWILPLNFWGRLAGLALLLLGCVYFFLKFIAVPLIQRINPLFAARAIEEARPSLKNSLINFLLLRTDRGSVRQPVFVAVERQAADQLSDIQVESTVDRSRVIVVGCVLTAILFLFAVYKILSTKDPLQTAQRILAPWARIDPSTRVTIIEIQPGSTRVYQGRFLTVTARLNHLGRDEPVNLFFTTADGQQLDRRVGMTLSEDELRYECRLPSEQEDSIGIQQDFVYRVEAGDARSQDYQVTVVPAPSIVVQEVRYDYPKYTGRESTVQKMQGDVRALEGTRVTVVARANLEIKSADVEFDPDRDDDSIIGNGADGRWSAGSLKRKPMKTEDSAPNEAEVDFTLKLQADRRTAEHASYQLRFRTLAGDQNDQPVQHRIQVLPDLPPEVEIIKPDQREREVPLDRQLTIEVRANDADYGLSRISLRCVSGGQDLIAGDLMKEPDGVPGQVIERYEFKPAALRLSVGETAIVWAVAEDNRRAPVTGAAAGNVARTPNYRIRVTAPQDPPAEDETSTDPRESQEETSDNAEQSQQPDQGSEESQGQSDRSDEADSSDSSDSSDQSDQSDSSTGEEGSPPEDGQPSGSGQEGADDGQPSDGAPSEGQPGSGDGQAQEPGQSDGAGGNNLQQRPFDHTGSEDGDVFDKLNQDREKSEGASSQGSDSGQPSGDGANQDNDGQPSETSSTQEGDPADGSPDQGTGQSPEGARQEQANPTDGGEGSRPTNPGQNTPESSAGQGDQPEERGSDPGEQADGTPQENDTPQPGDQQGEGSRREGESAEDPGGQPQGGDVPQTQDSPDSGSGQDQRPGMGDNSESGAGNKPGDDEGAPESQGGRQQRTGDQPQGNNQESDQNPNDGKSPANSSKPSESQGGEGGDRKGGGDQGGGQGSKQPGQDSAGSSSGADQGAGADSEPGDGQIGEKPGEGQPSERPTGQPGGESGAGSTSRPDPSGQAPGESASDSASGDSPQGPSPDAGDSSQPPGSEGSPQRGTPEGQQGRAPGGEGNRQGAGGDDPPPEGPGSQADKANVDYARKATDLALEHLEQMSDPDVERVLGWTPEQKRLFLERWRQQYRDAERTEASREDLDDTLRSLGLRPRVDRLERGASRADQPGGIQDTSRSAPPAEYRELFDAFKRGTARAGAGRLDE